MFREPVGLHERGLLSSEWRLFGRRFSAPPDWRNPLQRNKFQCSIPSTFPRLPLREEEPLWRRIPDIWHNKHKASAKPPRQQEPSFPHSKVSLSTSCQFDVLSQQGESQKLWVWVLATTWSRVLRWQVFIRKGQKEACWKERHAYSILNKRGGRLAGWQYFDRLLNQTTERNRTSKLWEDPASLKRCLSYFAEAQRSLVRQERS